MEPPHGPPPLTPHFDAVAFEQALYQLGHFSPASPPKPVCYPAVELGAVARCLCKGQSRSLCWCLCKAAPGANVLTSIPDFDPWFEQLTWRQRLRVILEATLALLQLIMRSITLF